MSSDVSQQMLQRHYMYDIQSDTGDLTCQYKRAPEPLRPVEVVGAGVGASLTTEPEMTVNHMAGVPRKVRRGCREHIRATVRRSVMRS